ncbi:hypothetical protein O6H91_17G030500 [Diphasiastrum complanatum]|uniref:Uncharacterized protein n=1 Tax=Diphasiastrum complanatum TaxID=34168 RepID=A0ACC2B5D4_DIPCM|nr:hypothetical protein O6H91_17G030500 [Diphasiastrum complanatum]
MVRTVVGDEAQIEAFLDSLFASSASVQIGLLIGRLSTGSNRDVVFGLVPTPTKDGEQACKVLGSTTQQQSKDLGDKRKSARAKPSIDSSSLMLDIDWVAEHARQVSRMLLGGMHVVGIYCLGTEVSIKNSLATLWQAVRAVASTQSLLADAEFVFEPLLLQVSSSPRRLSCRSCLLESNFTPASIKPCEWKLGKLRPTLHSFTCHHTFKIRLPLLENTDFGKDQPLRKLLLYEIQHEVERLKAAPVLVDGIMVFLFLDLLRINLDPSPETSRVKRVHEIQGVQFPRRDNITGAVILLSEAQDILL